MTNYKLFGGAVMVLLLAIALNTYIGLDNTSTIQSALRAQAVSLKASTRTRVKTVEARCELTADVAAITLLDRDVLLHFVPPRYGQAKIIAPYDKQLGVLAKSYVGCERQLAMVKKIDRATPSP